jgi:hypothetical protein
LIGSAHAVAVVPAQKLPVTAPGHKDWVWLAAGLYTHVAPPTGGGGGGGSPPPPSAEAVDAAARIPVANKKQTADFKVMEGVSLVELPTGWRCQPDGGASRSIFMTTMGLMDFAGVNGKTFVLANHAAKMLF